MPCWTGDRRVGAPRSARHSDCCSPYRPPPRPRTPLPPVPSVPSVPSISLPVTVPASQPCPGARRRSGARARRVAIGCLVNKARTRAGLRGFAWNRALARAATRHASDMARHGYFAHQRSGGPSVGAAGARGRLPRASRRRGDRLRLRLVEHPARDRPHVAGEPATPRDPALAAGAAWASASRAGRPCAAAGAARPTCSTPAERGLGHRLLSPGARPRRSRGSRARARRRSTAPARAARGRGRSRPRRARSRPRARRRGA